jgi:hypothetical protein
MVIIYCRMLKYWFKILKTENCIHKNCYENMFESSVFKSNDKLIWGCKITLHIHNLQYFLHMCQKVRAKSLY